MKNFPRGGAILAIACRAVAFCVGGSIFGLIAPEPHSFAKATLLPDQQEGRVRTFADRVTYQYAIEEIYWRHRIWPKENVRPKPSLDEVMSRAQIEKKVEGYLRNSELLADQQQPITSAELQAEMDRMASHTKDPEVLRELFAALNNDPFVIAECLARPILAERMLASSVVAAGVSPAPTKSFAADRAASTGKDTARYSLPEISVPLDCADDSWTPTSTTNAPSARSLHTAVWTGSEMIVWGGDGFAVLNTGGRYNPATDSWTATSLINAPSAREEHTAVWTGTEMIIWGGYANLNSGGKYNPGADSWTTIRTINAPSGRAFHTAVWSGSEMIVWGGSDGSSYLNTGGKYNPDTDSWVATSTSGAPAPRVEHTAIWTGSEMIVWSGAIGSNTGGKYNPGTDTWIPTSLINAPSARYLHTAVWTGNEMIIWGGNEETYLNTGGRYNPGTDSWTATTTTNAPTARQAHTAVWTGSEMIVWGGATSNSGVVNTGRRYIPTTNSWTPTSTTNAPVPRGAHTALWTGSEMIVWGGADASSHNINTGGKYCALSLPVLQSAGSTLQAESCSPSNSAIDPSETVTVSFCVQNSGPSNTTNLIGTLQATG